jgi:hypothetical protein
MNTEVEATPPFIKSERSLPCLHHSFTKLYPESYEPIPHLRYRSLNILFYARLNYREERTLARTRRISAKFEFESFVKVCGENPNLVKIGQRYLTLCMKT